LKRVTDKFRLQYELEINDRQNTNDPTQPANRNFSPTRNKVAIKYDNTININNAIGGEFEYRDSNYKPTATHDRSDQRLSAIIKYAYKFDKHWKLTAKAKYRNNVSNDSINATNDPDDLFDYKRTITTIDLSCVF
jgi:hypothetical protein